MVSFWRRQRGGERVNTAAAGGCGCAIIAAGVFWTQFLGSASVINQVGLSPSLTFAVLVYFGVIALYVMMVVGVVAAFIAKGHVRYRGARNRVMVAFVSVLPMSALVFLSTAASMMAWHNSQRDGVAFRTSEPVSYGETLSYLVQAVWNDTAALLPGVNELALTALESQDRIMVNAFVGAATFVFLFAASAPFVYAAEKGARFILRRFLGVSRA